MPDHSTTGEEPGSRERGSVDPASNVFAVPGPLENHIAGAGSHHLAPPIEEEDSPRSVDWAHVADHLPYGLMVFGPRQGLSYENGFCREFAGSSVTESGGIEEWLSALCPDEIHRDEVLRSWREHIWRNQLTRTFTLRGADQKLHEIEFQSSLLDDGGMTLTLRDVTDQVRAEEAQRNGKLKFRALFAQTENGAVLVDQVGRVLDANPAFLKLVGLELSELRMSNLLDLVHPRDAQAFAEGEKQLRRVRLTDRDQVLEQQVVLRHRKGEQSIRQTYCPIGEPGDESTLGLFLYEPDRPAQANGAEMVGQEQLAQRLRIVARKAQALLNAVPDLILLIDPDSTIADFAPPPRPWEMMMPDDSWRGQPIGSIWPMLGGILKRSRKALLEEGRSIQAEVEASRQGQVADANFDFGITATSAGDGQLLVVVRNLSLAGKQKTSAESSTEEAGPLGRERRQHGFRNQLQLVTSLFSFEPQSPAARDAFLKWQLRLRALAISVPGDSDDSLPVGDLLREAADEACTLTGIGPGRRTIVVAGDDELSVRASDASLFALFSMEWMRLVLAHPQQGPGPNLQFEFSREPNRETGGNSLRVVLRPGKNRRFLFTDEDSEMEVFEILSAQMRGQLEPISQNGLEAWQLTAPILAE